jgi:diguanylate cyclase (GGDEF)-like protein
MQIFRFAVIAGALGLAAYAPENIEASFLTLLAGGGAYALVSLVAAGLWRVLGKRNLFLFGGMLIVDGIYLAWLTYATGGTGSPLRNLIVLHLIAVTLLASYRTGLKLAMWHSLLLLSVHHAEQSGLLQPVGEGSTTARFHELVGFVGVFWLVALATATFSAVNERELRRRKFDLEALAQMSNRLEGTDDVRSVAEVLLDSLVDSFDFRRGLILGATGTQISLLAGRGEGIPVDPQGHFLGVDAVMKRSWESRESQLVSELDRSQNLCLSGLMGTDSHNLLVVPLIAEAGQVGVAVLEHSIDGGSRIERRVVATVERFCSQGALSLRNAALVQELRDLAATDGLTRIANRRTFQETLERELSRANRGGTDVTLVLLDIDHFKNLNDTHGHQAGDDVLRAVAQCLKESCRIFDTPARYGGEEFALILPGCSAQDSVNGADRFRKAVKAIESEFPVTVSAGVATYPLHASDVETLIGKADAALYRSKEGGRDRVSGQQASMDAEASEMFGLLTESEGS